MYNNAPFIGKQRRKLQRKIYGIVATDEASRKAAKRKCKRENKDNGK